MLTPGQIVELSIEKAAAGGRMLARHDGQVVLVSGVVPGERVTARIERTERRLAFASLVDLRQASPDRRQGLSDPACGGCVYSHIDYPRQLALKADILRDAFFRLGRLPIEEEIQISPSPERGYRTRARLHVEGARVGFYREGTHTLCDVAATGQVTERALSAVTSIVEKMTVDGASVTSAELAESVDASEMALLLTLADARAVQPTALAGTLHERDIKGCVLQDARGRGFEVGDPWIADPLTILTSDRVATGELRHRPESFFQANRFLLPELVTTVLDAAGSDGPVLDLYAGVGLFAVALAGCGRAEITAVEGDAASGADLEENARQSALPLAAVTVERDSVERYLQRRSSRAVAPKTVIVDPPRTGITAEALQSILKLSAPRLVYVSCDPATMARDAKRLVDGGYQLESLRGFDLFPNTPHVESLGVFSRTSA